MISHRTRYWQVAFQDLLRPVLILICSAFVSSGCLNRSKREEELRFVAGFDFHDPVIRSRVFHALDAHGVNYTTDLGVMSSLYVWNEDPVRARNILQSVQGLVVYSEKGEEEDVWIHYVTSLETYQEMVADQEGDDQGSEKK